ncbi:photosystem I reaction center subunit VIII, chloroplast precursor [Haematococcus lacustris]
MALSVRSSLACKSVSKPSAVRPAVKVAAVNPKVAGAGLASLAVAASFVAPVEAAQVISDVASAATGYPFVPPAWAPSVLVPLTGLVLPAVVMAWAFTYIEQEKDA